MSTEDSQSHGVFGETDPTEELLYALASHLLSVAAVWYGSHFALRRWITIQSLQPPEPLEAESTAPKPSAEKSKSTGPVWRRFLNKRFFKALAFGVGCVALEFAAIYILQRFATVLILDLIWSAFEFVLITWVVNTSIMVLWPFPSSVKYVHSTNSKAVGHEYWTDTGKPIYVKAAAGVFAAMVLSSSNLGSRILQPILIAAWVLNVFSPIEHYRMTVKYLLGLINGSVFATGAFTALIMGGIEVAKYFGVSGPHMPTQKTPSPWLSRLMTLFGASLPPMLAGMIIAMALRYDYSRHGSSPALRKDPGEAAQIQKQAPAFPKTTFWAGITGLAFSLVILDTLTFFRPSKEFLNKDHSLEMLWMYVVVPTVTLAIIYSTWQQGSLKNWWTYEERWWWTSCDSCQEALTQLRSESVTEAKEETDKSELEQQ